VSVANTAEGAFASQDFAGNIGNRILERFKVTLDYDHRRIWLEPGRRYKDRDRFTRTGLLLSWSPDSVQAYSVLKGSPAEKAGVHEGDLVRAIDGKPASSWSLEDLDELFENGADGRKVPIAVQRDGKEVLVTMQLKEMLK
jgi:predicted metalloprotease with PDZ domain